MDVAKDLEYVGQKLAKYREKIGEARDAGLYTRDAAKVEEKIHRVFKLQRKARAQIKTLPPSERRAEVTKAYSELHHEAEAIVKNLLDFRAELLLMNLSPALNVER
ncbi:MAG: hypothetical protein U0166_29120 [Acidobacteriota bacterium]